MADRPDDRAQRVERVLETGDLNRAMNTLKDEMAHVTSPDERASVLRSLKEQNDRANKSDWTLPNVSIEQNTNWYGGKKDGEYNVNFSHNIFEKAAFNAHPMNTAGREVNRALGN